LLGRKDIFCELFGLQRIDRNEGIVINQTFLPGALERSGEILLHQFIDRAGSSAFLQEMISEPDYITLFQQSDTAPSARTKKTNQ
jgi:hypothetical protein